MSRVLTILLAATITYLIIAKDHRGEVLLFAAVVLFYFISLAFLES